jgi:hypothetical protein
VVTDKIYAKSGKALAPATFGKRWSSERLFETYRGVVLALKARACLKMTVSHQVE